MMPVWSDDTMNLIGGVALFSATLWFGIALVTMWWEYYEIAAIAFMLVALSIYVYEVKKRD